MKKKMLKKIYYLYFVLLNIIVFGQNITPTNHYEPFTTHFTHVDTDGKIRNETLDNSRSWLLTEEKRISSTTGGEIKFTVNGTQIEQVIGFSDTQQRYNNIANPNYLNYGLNFKADGTFCTYRGLTSSNRKCDTYSDGDQFSIKMQNDTIHYVQNGVEFQSYVVDQSSYAMDMFLYKSFDNVNYIQNASLTNFDDNSVYDLKSLNNYVKSFSKINASSQIDKLWRLRIYRIHWYFSRGYRYF